MSGGERVRVRVVMGSAASTADDVSTRVAPRVAGGATAACNPRSAGAKVRLRAACIVLETLEVLVYGRVHCRVLASTTAA
jgi:predicted RecB family endonuclease